MGVGVDMVLVEMKMELGITEIDGDGQWSRGCLLMVVTVISINGIFGYVDMVM